MRIDRFSHGQKRGYFLTVPSKRNPGGLHTVSLSKHPGAPVERHSRWRVELEKWDTRVDSEHPDPRSQAQPWSTGGVRITGAELIASADIGTLSGKAFD
jgi:hypothetical protein